MDNPYDGWSEEDELAQRQHNARWLPKVYATDELVRELNRRGYEVARTDPERGLVIVMVQP